MTLWNKIKILKIFVQLVRNPKRTELIFEGVEIVSSERDQAPVQALENLVLANKGFREMYKENYIPEAPSMEELKKCPEGSFGQALYQHMTTNNLVPPPLELTIFNVMVSNKASGIYLHWKKMKRFLCDLSLWKKQIR